MSTPKLILLVAAMEQEAAPLCQAMALRRVTTEGRYPVPFQRFETTLGGTRVVLSLNGKDSRFGNENVGLELAALNTYDSIYHYHPDLVINFGTAGSFASKGAEIGTVYLSDRHFFFHDHRIPLPGYDEYGRGFLPGLDVQSLASKFSLPIGAVSSGSSLDFTDTDLDEIHRNGAVIKEMEAAAIAWACHLTGKPFFAIKAVTDLIGPGVNAGHEFVKNFDKAVKQLTSVTTGVVTALCEGGFPELLLQKRE